MTDLPVPLANLLATEAAVAQTTFKNHPQEIADCREGVSLCVEVWSALSGIDFRPNTGEEASRIISWRYLCTLPSTALWALNAAIPGQYDVAGSLLRLQLEEAIGVIFYSQDKQEALRHVLESPGRDRLDFEEKLDKLGIPRDRTIRRFYGELSNTFSHANALPRAGMVVDKADGGRMVYAGPSYDAASFSAIAVVTQRTLRMGLSAAALNAFPNELQAAPSHLHGRIAAFAVRASKAIMPA